MLPDLEEFAQLEQEPLGVEAQRKTNRGELDLSFIYILRDRLHHMGPPQCFIYDFIDAIGSQGFLVFWGMDCYHAWPALFLHVVRPVADSTLTRWLPKIGVAFLLPRDELKGL